MIKIGQKQLPWTAYFRDTAIIRLVGTTVP